MIVGQWVSFGLGGADKASYYLIKGLIELGVDVRIFYNEWSFPKPSPQLDSGVLLLSRYDQYKDLNVPMFEIKNVENLNNYNLNILNTHRGGDDFWLIPGLEKLHCNFKIVETNFHGNLFTRADVRVFPSYTMIESRSIQYRYVIIPNPIMPKLSNYNLRKKFNIEGKFVFGRIGRPAKDIYSDTCLRAYKILENENNFFIYVAPCNEARMDAHKLGIKNILFIDQILDEVYISKLYNTFDVMCHSNKMGETFGNTIAEAMMHGKPVVSHFGKDWPQAQKEVLGIDYSKHYVCENNAEKYSSLMNKLMTDKHEYDLWSLFLELVANKYYNYKSVAAKYIELYKRIVI